MTNPIYYIPHTFLDVCIALTSSIAALFIPLFYTVVIRLDEKYESRLIIRFFWVEKVVRRFLISTIILMASTIVYSLKFEPWFLINNFFIANSAAIIAGLVLIVNIILGFYSLTEMSKYQDPERLFNHIRVSKNFTEKQRRLVRFDLLFHSLKDLNHNKDFTEKICDELENEILCYKDKQQNIPIEYFDALEQLSASVFGTSLNNETRQNKQAVLSLWGTIFFTKFPMDDLTYSFMWHHLVLAIENDWDFLVQKHWERGDSLIKMKGLRSRGIEIYDLPFEERKIEKSHHDEFILFFIALGALLLYKRKTILLRSCLEYTSSWPPEYYLIPKNSHSILEYFKELNDPRDNKNIWLFWKYKFSVSTGFEQDLRIRGSINQYLILLLLRISLENPDSLTIDFREMDKFESTKYIYTLDILLKEISNISEFDFLNQVLTKRIDETDIEVLSHKVKEFQQMAIIHKKKLKSEEGINQLKIDVFCDNVAKELSGFIEEISKIKRKRIIESPVSIKFRGFKSTVDKDFFIEKSEVAYLNYEETFASVFKQNLQNKLGYEIDQKVILNLISNAQEIFDAVKSFGNSVIILNFGFQLLQDLNNNSQIVNLGRVTGVTPRVFIINSLKNDTFGIQFEKIILHKDFDKIKTPIPEKMAIGLGKLSKGKLIENFQNEVSRDIELDQIMGVEIGTAISLYVPESLKCVCLIEHQPYRNSKDPDKVDCQKIINLLELD
jgi:hypothetical protein